MAVVSVQVQVGTTPTLLSGSADGGAPGIAVAVTNQGAASIFLGGPAVTTAGYELVPGATATADLVGSDELYGIVASGTVRADVLRTGT